MRRAAWMLLPLALSGCSDMGPGSRPAVHEVPRSRLASPEARERGRRLYLRHCALCHGREADGRGVRRSALHGDPRDFTSPLWRRRVTASEVYDVIRNGVEGTSMPAWNNLDRDEIWDLVAYLLSVGDKGA